MHRFQDGEIKLMSAMIIIDTKIDIKRSSLLFSVNITIQYKSKVSCFYK